MTLLILAGLLALTHVPGGLAMPQGIRVRDQADNCITKCRANWGWPGYKFNGDPWGAVVDPKLSAGDAGSGVGGEPSSEASSTTLLITASPTSPSAYYTYSTTSKFSSSTSSSSSNTKTSSSTAFSSSSSSSSSAPPPPTSTSIFTPSSSPPPKPSSSSSSSSLSSSSSPSQSPSSSPSEQSSSSSSSTSSASNSGSGSTSGGTSQSDIQAYLDGHNTIRSQHGAAPLTYSQDLAAKAQQWSNGCVFKHSGGSLGPFGENLAAGTGDGYGIPQALKSWTDEASQYDPNNPQPSHFTQVVWKGTTQVGCAVQDCDGIFDASFGKAHFYTCEYSAQGNIIGQFAQNVQA